MTLRRWFVIALVALAGIAGLIIAAQVNDRVNMLYKRLKTSDRYVFEEVRPELAAQDPLQFLSITTADQVAEKRRALSALVYGTDGTRQPVAAQRIDGDSLLRDQAAQFAHSRGVARYYLTPKTGVLSFFYVLLPEQDNPTKAVIYHHGFAGSFVQRQDFIEDLLAQGYVVVAIDQLCYGENAREAPCEISDDPDCRANLQFHMDKLIAPLAMHVEPVRAAIDLLQDQGVEDFAAVGFSAGAGTVILSAALDTRITRSVGIAGVLPYYLREGQDAPIGIAQYQPLRQRASMMDLFLMGAVGEGRAQKHIFNRYDRCCFRNVKGLLYQPALEGRVEAFGLGGDFSVAIDETHARHTVSPWASQVVIDFLKQ